MAQIPEVDIVRHFDLLTKYNEQGALYDTQSSWYRDAAFAAMETLNAAGKIFEMKHGRYKPWLQNDTLSLAGASAPPSRYRRTHRDKLGFALGKQHMLRL